MAADITLDGTQYPARITVTGCRILRMPTWGYAPRCALDYSYSGVVRLTEIVKPIAECAFSVHDISRVEKETFESWYENPIDLSGRWYLQAIVQLFKENRLTNGTFAEGLLGTPKGDSRKQLAGARRAYRTVHGIAHAEGGLARDRTLDRRSSVGSASLHWDFPAPFSAV